MRFAGLHLSSTLFLREKQAKTQSKDFLTLVGSRPRPNVQARQCFHIDSPPLFVDDRYTLHSRQQTQIIQTPSASNIVSWRGLSVYQVHFFTTNCTCMLVMRKADPTISGTADVTHQTFVLPDGINFISQSLVESVTCLNEYLPVACSTGACRASCGRFELQLFFQDPSPSSMVRRAYRACPPSF